MWKKQNKTHIILLFPQSLLSLHTLTNKLHVMKRIVLTNLMLLLALFAFGQEEDKTQYITNPSFENGTNGWSVDGLARQDNNSFTLKAGTYYMEKWTSSGNSVGNGSVKQVIQNLPRGQYKLTVSAQNLSQNNTSKKNTGAYIFAGDDKETRGR